MEFGMVLMICVIAMMAYLAGMFSGVKYIENAYAYDREIIRREAQHRMQQRQTTYSVRYWRKRRRG